ncbi:hypothetical protein E2562_033467 [Oryza meyeriana var. granulata]|uniref:Uncharacterized protein n=1 Tax=Oryza meyeriana var. granulata TaxID=110450 RepID=A0A6G1E6I0_9ORYZ|nr:hypothetical protein E2562_033467 [Oryza meyeriana var. granulata]
MYILLSFEREAKALACCSEESLLFDSKPRRHLFDSNSRYRLLLCAPAAKPPPLAGVRRLLLRTPSPPPGRHHLPLPFSSESLHRRCRRASFLHVAASSGRSCRSPSLPRTPSVCRPRQGGGGRQVPRPGAGHEPTSLASYGLSVRQEAATPQVAAAGVCQDAATLNPAPPHHPLPENV